MFELVKVLLEIAEKLFNGIEQSKDESFDRIGQKLFLVYFRANEVVDSAYDILKCMESYRIETDYRRENGKKDIYEAPGHFLSISYTLKNQIFNLERLSDCIARVETEFVLLDGSLRRQLFGLVEGKANALSKLESVLHSGNFSLVEPDRKNIEKEISFQERMSFSRENIFFDEDNVVKDRHGSKHQYEIICDFLDSGEPQARIHELEKHLNHMRSVLEKNWTLKNILPKFGKNLAS